MILAMRQGRLTALSMRSQYIFKYASDRIVLGEPARFRVPGPGGGIWLVWDGDIRGEHLAILGAMAADFSRVPNSYEPRPDPDTNRPGKTRQELAEDVRAYLDGHLVWPVDVADEENPGQAILDAQGAPQADIRALNGIPDGWVPVGEAG